MTHFNKKIYLASAKHFELNSGIFKALKNFLNFLPKWFFTKIRKVEIRTTFNGLRSHVMTSMNSWSLGLSNEVLHVHVACTYWKFSIQLNQFLTLCSGSIIWRCASLLYWQHLVVYKSAPGILWVRKSLLTRIYFLFLQLWRRVFLEPLGVRRHIVPHLKGLFIL